MAEATGRQTDGRARQSVLITGGSRGIGRAVAVVAAQAGWNVAVNYRGNLAAAEQTAQMVRDAGGAAITIAGGVAQEADVIAMFDAAEAEFGGLDAVVVNAGILAPALMLEDMGVERLKAIFDTNVLGAVLTTREAIRRLSKGDARNQSIVFISSAAARLGGPSQYVDYAASKGAIDTLTHGLAKEVGARGIRVNAIRPGLIETEIHASGGEPDRATRLGPTVPMGRAGSAEEVAEAVVWLMGPRSSYVNGAILDVAGGR